MTEGGHSDLKMTFASGEISITVHPVNMTRDKQEVDVKAESRATTQDLFDPSYSVQNDNKVQVHRNSKKKVIN